ncbi:Ca2+-transporting ATPase [Chitinophaga polysaccharea]|uniref:P-type Cu(+) transporter n=1 Tax=Chitinophaga polysaccharea TaxID=1293035 RepID=A0A561PR72_9BACT|nr:cation-transporting P-type ATPase [Chitinophaga polysaccharea]TWF40626.1 Ca2+-transporting ATPase [Chitinophaga polysaccharea]
MLSSQNEENNKYWALDADTIAKVCATDSTSGLTREEAAKRLIRYGYNNVITARKNKALLILLRQFTSPFTLLLGISTILSFFFREWLDGFAILIVIILNIIVGFLMEYQAHRSIKALEKLNIVHARIIRDGQMVEIKSDLLVPGDLLFVETGGMVTADARIINSKQLQVDESMLSGESFPADKICYPLPANTALVERHNMLYKGTLVTKGNGLAIIVNTGIKTEVGKLADIVQQSEQTATPLEIKVRQLSTKLIWITLALIIVILTGSFFYGTPVTKVIKIAIALSVAAIPEGLPVVTTLVLSFGVLRMAKHKAIIKKLSAVETLGEINVICTDKTGTLTKNNIEVSLIHIPDLSAHVQIDATGTSIHWMENNCISRAIAYDHLCKISALCNTAVYQPGGDVSTTSGSPLEIALLKMVHASGAKLTQYQQAFSKIDELPFSSETRVMFTRHKEKDRRQYYVSAKGAAEEILKYCTSVEAENGKSQMGEEEREQWKTIATKHAQSGFRMLAFAYRETSAYEQYFMHDLTLAGIIGFSDPLREGVKEAIKECKKAGIRIVMITGDHPETAKNIALQLGISTPTEEVMPGSAMKPYDQLTVSDREKWLNSTVFARVSPEQKQQLIAVLQDERMIVAMTGDGVNDAPALKKADIGVAMGQRGTQVAREAADMILKDDAFTTIVSAVRQGRIILENIRKYVIFLLSCNLSELLTFTVCALFNLPFQLLPLQILFINFVTDVMPALALGVSYSGDQIMQRKPYPPGTPIIDKKRWMAILVYSLIITVTTLAAVATSYLILRDKEQKYAVYNNILFYTLIFSQLLQVFNMTFNRKIAFHKTDVFRNQAIWYSIAGCVILSFVAYWTTPVRLALEITSISWQNWSIILLYSILPVVIIRCLKKWKWTI